MASVLILDDEVTLRKLVSRVLQLEGYEVFEASNLKEAAQVLQREHVQVLISDVKLPDGNGVEFIKKVKTEFPGIEAIVLTAYGTIQEGVKAMKYGAFDYLTKGDHQDKLVPLLSKAMEKAQLQQKLHDLESSIQKRFGFASILGQSRPISQCRDLAMKVAATSTTVLLLGETGTGKEVFARAIHYEGVRKTMPFIALNCSAFPKDLLESELFGHAEGAFTGASRSKRGLVEEAHEGTLFLDEIGEMSPELQSKLLRLIESKEYYRVGETKERSVDIRIIAATNRRLDQEVQAGRFREDLYYRLSVFTISLPPLRERQEDIEVFARHFAQDFAMKMNKPAVALQPAFIKSLREHPWKGNIRELKNVVERCIILADGPELDPDLLPSDFNVGVDGDAFDLVSVEKRHIRHVLNQTGGNKTRAAKLLGIGLTTLYQKIKDYQL